MQAHKKEVGNGGIVELFVISSPADEHRRHPKESTSRESNYKFTSRGNGLKNAGFWDRSQSDKENLKFSSY